MRRFFGGYQPNFQRLADAGYIVAERPRLISIASAPEHGSGRIKGTTKKVGANYSAVSVCVFKRSNRQLLWETTSKPDGTYEFRNIAKDLECFIVAFDPNDEFNAVISDKVVAK
nr:carboxypeptidase regulatory-like domain-containing protein [Acinetobacter variabilis]